MTIQSKGKLIKRASAGELRSVNSAFTVRTCRRLAHVDIPRDGKRRKINTQVTPKRYSTTIATPSKFDSAKAFDWEQSPSRRRQQIRPTAHLHLSIEESPDSNVDEEICFINFQPLNQGKMQAAKFRAIMENDEHRLDYNAYISGRENPVVPARTDDHDIQTTMDAGHSEGGRPLSELGGRKSAVSNSPRRKSATRRGVLEDATNTPRGNSRMPSTGKSYQRDIEGLGPRDHSDQSNRGIVGNLDSIAHALSLVRKELSLPPRRSQSHPTKCDLCTVREQSSVEIASE